MKEVKYADCANCIHRVFDEETYLKTNCACLVDENDIERFKKKVCKAFKAKEEVKMTDKEKAIKALNAIKYFEESWYPDLFPIIEKQLNQPTLDDAIAVVESMKKSLPTLTSREIINVYKRVLTALKGLKEGKRSEQD